MGKKVLAKKVLAMVVVLVVACCAFFTGCTNATQTGSNRENENATLIKVGNFDGGIGDEWLYALKKRFEDAYKDVSFEEGKMGVEVSITTDKKFIATSYSTSIASEDYDIIFTERFNYNDWVTGNGGKGYLKDISAIINDTIPGEEKSIAQKIDSTVLDFYNRDGAVYAIPFWESYYGISYDIDLFKDKGFYLRGDANNNYKAIKTNGEYSFVGPNKFAADGTTTEDLSYGPDGKHGTYDDGLPATYEEFYAMMDYMVANGVTPFVWAGKYPGYFSMFLTSLWVNHNGADEVIASFDLENESARLIDIENGVATEAIKSEINTDNGYLMAKQSGKYYALKFAEKVLSNSDYYYHLSTNEEFTHTAAQDEFIVSVPSTSKQAIGMLVEGAYWFNEASDTLETCGKRYGSEYGVSRNVGFMPLPAATEENIGKGALPVSVSTAMFVNANVADSEMEVIKAFIQFAHTDYSLSEFTSLTNVPLGYDYELNTEMSYKPFAKSLYEVRDSSQIVYPYSKSTIFLKNQGSIYDMETGIWSSTVGGTPYRYPLNAMKLGSEHFSAETYFDGMLTFLQDSWASIQR